MKSTTLTFLCCTLFPLGAWAAQVELKAAVAKPILPAGEKHLTHLKVGLTGADIKPAMERAPVNLAIVLDRSGSMKGEKIAQAKVAACLAVRALAPTDIISVVTFSAGVEVLVPATKATDSAAICQKIDSIVSDGGTALFAGVSKGAAEMRKFLNQQSINRVILLSDGIANVGPATPGELAELGGSLIKEGISVTTIGLGGGYNEDLMTRLAEKSDGRHAFVDKPQQLAQIFEDEIGSVKSVVAQKVHVEILCDPGVRPVRVLGREATIVGNKVTLNLNQIYRKEEKYLILEVEVPESASGITRDLARVEVRYENVAEKIEEKLNQTVIAKFSNVPAEVEAAVNKDVLVAWITQVGNSTNEAAVKLRDEGKVDEAKKLLMSNGGILGDWGNKLNSPELQMQCASNITDAKNLDGDWNVARKQMKDNSYALKNSQGFAPQAVQTRRADLSEPKK
jgi:Ca-activated chloride channel family protein